MQRICRLAFKEYGDRTLPTLVLLMGLGMPSGAWPESLIRLLVQQGLHVITPDNRDCGQSDFCSETVSFWSLVRSVAWYLCGGTVKAPYSIEDMAFDVEALLDEQKLERVHIAGVSLGGMIAQAFAIRAPHRTVSLSCISTATGNPRTGLGQFRAVRSMLKNCSETDDSQTRYKRLTHLLKTIGSPEAHYSNVELARYMQVLKDGNVTQQSVRRQLMAVLAGGDRRSKLRQLVVPTLVIHGQADSLLPVQAGQELAECIEGAKLIRIAGMGHDLPECFIRTIGLALAKHCYSGVLR